MTGLAQDVIGTKGAAEAAQFSSKGHVDAIVVVLDNVDKDRDGIPSDAIPPSSDAVLSNWNHDAVRNLVLGQPEPDAPPVGKGVIVREGSKGVFHGDYFTRTRAGAEAFARTQALGSLGQWSFSYRGAAPEAPNAAWRARGALRVLSRLLPFEASPVTAGACGPACSTVDARSAKRGGASCGCGPSRGLDLGHAPRPADLVEWIPSYEQGKAAREVFDYACRRLGLRARPALKWFRPNGRASGQFLEDRSEVWIRTGLDPLQTQVTIVHELVHAKQLDRGEFFEELDAESRAWRIVRELESGEADFWRAHWAAA